MSSFKSQRNIKKLVKSIRLHPANRAFWQQSVNLLNDGGFHVWPDARIVVSKEEIQKALSQA